MEYALIIDGVVSNLIYLHPMNASEFSNVVPTNGLPVRIGDTYIDGAFYHNDVQIKANPFEDEDYGLNPEIVIQIKNDAITEVEEAVVNGTYE